MQLFRPLLNIQVEFSAEEFETALLTPNDTLADVHMPLLKVGASFFGFSEVVVLKVLFLFNAFRLSSVNVGPKSSGLY